MEKANKSYSSTFFLYAFGECLLNINTNVSFTEANNTPNNRLSNLNKV